MRNAETEMNEKISFCYGHNAILFAMLCKYSNTLLSLIRIINI